MWLGHILWILLNLFSQWEDSKDHKKTRQLKSVFYWLKDIYAERERDKGSTCIRVFTSMLFCVKFRWTNFLHLAEFVTFYGIWFRYLGKNCVNKFRQNLCSRRFMSLGSSVGFLLGYLVDFRTLLMFKFH